MPCQKGARLKLMENTEKIYFVYKHTSPSGKVYIGVSRQKPELRWGNGTSAYANNRYFVRAINKYGWGNFQHDILFSGLTYKEASDKEIELIALYDSTNPIKGYNISTGGYPATGCTTNLGSHRTDSQKKHMSEVQKQMVKEGRNTIAQRNKTHAWYFSMALKAKYPFGTQKEGTVEKMLAVRKAHGVSYKGENNPNYGKVPSAKTKSIWHKQRAGRALTDEWKKNISKNSQPCRPIMCKETGEVFKSFAAAARFLGMSSTKALSLCCHGKQESLRGYHWVFKEDYDKEILKKAGVNYG